MKRRTFLIIPAIFSLSVAIFLIDPTGIYLSEAYGQRFNTEKEWLTCRKKLEIMAEKEKIGTPGFESAVVEICGKRPGKVVKEGTGSSKADLPFKIDCTELDSERQALCNSYITSTRDEAYPHLREITGTSLSKCYDAVYYKIVPGSPSPSRGAGGLTSRNRITYDQRYSVDSEYRYDVHELLHSISQCNGALDAHVFHGAILNAVYVRMGSKSQYAKEKESENQKRLIKAAETAAGADLCDKCRAILGEEMTVAYFDLGEEAIRRLYQTTISPHPASLPNKRLVDLWGKSSSIKVQALLEVLKGEYHHGLSVPACGY